MTTVLYAWPYGGFIEILSNLKRKKLHRKNQHSNFLRGSFSNKDNITAPIQFRRASQPQNLKTCFFLRNRPIHFSICDFWFELKWFWIWYGITVFETIQLPYLLKPWIYHAETNAETAMLKLYLSFHQLFFLF